MNKNYRLLEITTEYILNTTESSIDTTIRRDILADFESVVRYLCSV
jgi:hypothetical protein